MQVQRDQVADRHPGSLQVAGGVIGSAAWPDLPRTQRAGVRVIGCGQVCGQLLDSPATWRLWLKFCGPATDCHARRVRLRIL